MKIRKANIKDIGKIADIEISSGYRWRMKKEDEIKMAKKILRSKSLTYILEDKKPIGYFVVRLKNRICYIDFFAVIKAKQRKGIGRWLMKKIINLAKKNKCKIANVAVWAKNFPVVGLCNKFSFYVTKIKRKHYPNKDGKLIMEKKL